MMNCQRAVNKSIFKGGQTMTIWVQEYFKPRGNLHRREYLLLAVNNAPPPKPVVIKMTQRE